MHLSFTVPVPCEVASVTSQAENENYIDMYIIKAYHLSDIEIF